MQLNRDRSDGIRRVVVIPGHEIHILPFPGSHVRFICFPAKKLITMPGVTGFSKEELELWQKAYAMALGELGWD